MADADPPPDTRRRIEEALCALMAEGEKLNHDNVATRAGVSRRTVYRHFPDQPALRAGMWSLLSVSGAMPHDLEDLLNNGMRHLYRNFDSRAAEMTVAMASAEGRAIRNTVTEERVAAYRALYAEATADLPEPDRTWAIGALQFIGTGLAWRELRDQWQMDGDAIATTTVWAIRTLLADLKKRGDLPLSAGPADDHIVP